MKEKPQYKPSDNKKPAPKTIPDNPNLNNLRQAMMGRKSGKR